MRLILLAWSVIFLYGHVIPNMAFEGKPSSKQEDFTLSEPGKYGKFHDLNETERFNGEDERKEHKENYELFHSMKGQKGKGAYGGANIVHRPRPGEKNAAVLTGKPSFFVSATMLYVSWALVLVFFSILS